MSYGCGTRGGMGLGASGSRQDLGGMTGEDVAGCR